MGIDDAGQDEGPDNAGQDGAPDDTGQDGGPDDTASASTGETSDPFEFESYYGLLGVSADATGEEIERAYRELAKRHHPDASERPEREAERHFRQLLTARDVLTNAERRRAYDELGHEEYRRQSAELGEPVADADQPVGRDASPEPRPEPGVTRTSDPGQAQRSARGAAHRRGDPLVTSADEAFAGSPPDGTPERENADEPDAADRDRASGRGVYQLVFEDGPLESRSLQSVRARWAASWRNRAVVGVVAVVLAAAALAALPAALDALEVDAAAPAATAGLLYGVALVATLAYAGYSCGTAEARLPRGQFLADRDHGRFSMATSRAYQRRGVAALALVLALAVASARAGARPWAHTADAARGDLSGPFPWFDAPAVLAGWTGALDVLVTGVFALAAVSGTLLISVGVSIALWRGRYERGRRVRPSLWEPVFVLTLVSVPFALAVGPVGLVSLPPLSALPGPVAAAAGVDGSTITVATMAVAGIVLSLVSVPLLRLRLALASSEHAEDNGAKRVADETAGASGRD